MQWLATNWFWVLIGGSFVGMQLFGHGGHGGDAGHGGNAHPERSDVGETKESPGRQTTGSTGEHQH